MLIPIKLEGFFSKAFYVKNKLFSINVATFRLWPWISSDLFVSSK